MAFKEMELYSMVSLATLCTRSHGHKSDVIKLCSVRLQDVLNITEELSAIGVNQPFQPQVLCYPPKMEASSCYDTDLLKSENENLLEQNKLLRKKLYLLQENIHLKNLLGQSSPKQEETQPCGLTTKHQEEENNTNESTPYMDTMDSPMDGNGLTDGCRYQTDESTQYGDLDSQQLHLMQRIIGEIAFQLDRRILTCIFPDQGRLYGVTVANIPQKIIEASTDCITGRVDEKKQAEMMQRYVDTMSTLQECGYDTALHPAFSENVVNVYGIMKEYPPAGSPEISSLCDLDNLKKIAYSTVPSSHLDHILILLKCLSKLSTSDGKPILLL
ncbi:uncharacterized protein LOC130272744 isoform X2 [Hyla sarda]|uniref:uncharacterized protein LOC130272744 isoform X2 n=1 Tax=Hyla sarda TaxID=327740 RepID=UPI0024C2521F|nr:uncharacterized protein LOC130272744 isoform X2 [Hyla sarda]